MQDVFGSMNDERWSTIYEL